MKTFNHVAEIFKAPEEIQISYLQVTVQLFLSINLSIYRLTYTLTLTYMHCLLFQDSAIQQIREYREVKMSKLGWEFVIENHKFRDIDIQLQSSYIVIPYKGEYKEVIYKLIKLKFLKM